MSPGHTVYISCLKLKLNTCNCVLVNCISGVFSNYSQAYLYNFYKYRNKCKKNFKFGNNNFTSKKKKKNIFIIID